MTAYHNCIARLRRRTTGISKWMSAVELCPLLRLDGHQEATALDRIKRYDWQEGERVKLVGLPAQNTTYANMILTDPPVDKVHAELTYKHSLHPLLMIRARRYVENTGSPLTISAVISRACSEPGPLYLHDPSRASNNYHASHQYVKQESINGMMSQKTQEHDGNFALDLTDSQFVFQDYNYNKNNEVVISRVVVPCPEERLEMEAKRAQTI